MKNTDLHLLEKLLDSKLETVNVTAQNTHSMVKDIKKILYGNGRKGLIEQVDCNKDNIQGMLGKIGMLSAFFGLIIAGMFEIITKFFTKKIGLE